MTSVGTLLAASEPDFDAVELSLTSLEHHFLIVAPKPGKMRALQEGMAGRLPRIRAGLRPTYAELRLPRYSVNNSLRLREALNKAGVVTAFSESADFGAMVEGRVFLDQVLQNVAFEVNERGLRAASATVASYPPPSAPQHPVLIQINRPFLFGLMNLRTGTMLFWGTYAGRRGLRFCCGERGIRTLGRLLGCPHRPVLAPPGLRASCLPQIPCSASGLRAEWREAVAAHAPTGE